MDIVERGGGEVSHTLHPQNRPGSSYRRLQTTFPKQFRSYALAVLFYTYWYPYICRAKGRSTDLSLTINLTHKADYVNYLHEDPLVQGFSPVGLFMWIFWRVTAFTTHLTLVKMTQSWYGSTLNLGWLIPRP